MTEKTNTRHIDTKLLLVSLLFTGLFCLCISGSVIIILFLCLSIRHVGREYRMKRRMEDVKIGTNCRLLKYSIKEEHTDVVDNDADDKPKRY